MLTKKINARGNAIIYAYDAWRQLISSSAGTQFSYDDFGKITSVSDAAGTREFTYNTFGELETETCGNAGISELRDDFGRSLGYVYSKSGTAQQTTSVGYDSASGRIASAGFLHGGNVKNFTYNYLAGTRLLAQLVCPNNMTQNLTYEATSDLIIGMKFKRGATDVVTRNYAYDNLSRPISRSTARQGSVQNDTFAYNSRSELVAGTLGGNAFNFAFDEIGNQTQFACNATNETTIEGDFVPAYDADGNATLIKTATGTWSVSYNAENRPIRFECAGTQTVVEMNYDYLGRRFEKKITVAGTTTLHHRYIYRGFLQIACLDLTRAGTPALWFVFWDPTQPTGTRPLAIQKNGTWFVYGHDLTKNVCELVDSSGNLAATYDYAPFGAVTTGTPAGTSVPANPLQWSSEICDSELDLVYYNYRHYSPSLGRFLSRDPIEEQGGLNLYLAVENCMLSQIDFGGMSSCAYFSQVFDGAQFSGKRVVGKPRGAVEGVSTDSAKGIGIGYFVSTGIELKGEVCQVSCRKGGCGRKFKGSALFFVNIGLSGASHAFRADVTFRKGDWNISGGVNAWAGIRTYGQVFGKGGGEVELNTCDGPNSNISGKLYVGGEFGLEVGGEATAYLSAGWKSLQLKRRLGVGLAGGGRIGVSWDISAQCSNGICQISGPLDFYAEAYVRAQLLGFNMDVGISGSESAGVKTVSFKNPINLL